MGRPEAEPLSEGATELSFESAEQLFEALETPDAVERRNVLGWVATHPAETIALGPHGGRDVLDHLLGLIDRDLDFRYWEDLAITVGAFDDPRATDFFVDLLATADEALQAYDAASALSRRRGSPGWAERLTAIVTADGPPERLAATAELLAGEPGLPAAAAIRVGSIELEHPVPPLDGDTREAWMAELGGQFADGAQERLQEQGAPALRDLAHQWDRLGAEQRGWLLDWAIGAEPEEPVSAALVARALEPGSELAPEGLRAAARLPREAVAAEAIDRWADDERSEVRAAAIAAGADVQVEALLAGGAAEPELAEALPRAAAALDPPRAAELIAPHLRSDSLEVRSAARDAIVGLGPAAVEPLRGLVTAPEPEARAAAVRALLDLGDDDWLREELLGEGSG